VVLTEGSPLYPALRAARWPLAEHPLCLFHVLKEIHHHVLAGVRSRLQSLRRRGGRGGGRPGRPTKQPQAQRQRPRNLKEQAAFGDKHRYRIVTRRDRLRPRQQRWLVQVLEDVPSARVLRRFLDDVHRLLDRAQTLEQARSRYEELRADPEYGDTPELAPARKLLAPAAFAKRIAFWRSPVGQRPRTNNHVERRNRTLRH
jgi:hypothetical protein